MSFIKLPKYLFFIIVLWSMVSTAALAIEVVAEGRSPILDDIGLAQQAAAKNAIKNAVHKFGSHVRSVTTVSNGSIQNETTEISSNGKVRNVKILNEYQEDGVYIVKVKVLIEEASDCRNPENANYNKSLLFTKIPLLKPHTANVGQLGDISERFAHSLSKKIYPAQGVYVHVDSDIVLTGENDFISGPQQQMSLIQSLAEKYNVQFVASGHVNDMSMKNPAAYHEKSSEYQHLKNWYRKMRAKVRKKDGYKDVRIRNFSFTLDLYDGYSGERIYNKRYEITGVWDAKYNELIGYDTPRFWETKYGKDVAEITQRAVADVGAKINCQPFIMPVEVDKHNKSIYMLAGANNGVDIGDTFDLYVQGEVAIRSSVNYSLGLNEYPVYKTLQKQDSQMIVNQVYPTYSAAKLTKPLIQGKRYIAVFK